MTLTQDTVRPLGNRVLVKRSEAITSKGGILLPDSAKEKPRQGTIISVGPGATSKDGKKMEMSVAIGQTVLFSSYAGTQIEEDLILLSEDDILGILEG